MSAQGPVTTSSSSFALKSGSTSAKDDHIQIDNENDSVNAKAAAGASSPRSWAEEQTVQTSNRGMTQGQQQQQQQEGGGGKGQKDEAKTSKMFHHKVRSAFKRAPLKLESTRIQKVKEVQQDNGTKHFRVTGARTGNENGHDIVDRNIPFSYKCAEALNFLRTLPDVILYWSFTCKFWKFMIASIALFYGLNLLFAFLIIASALRYPECINPNMDIGVDFEFAHAMRNAFHLSWTTFSTVGYGLISPATTGHFDQPWNEYKITDQKLCAGINLLLSFESLIGVLFVGFCSAIIFGKLTRFQSNAQVMFSTKLIVKFGEGFMEDEEDDDDGNGNDEGVESETVTTYATADASTERSEASACEEKSGHTKMHEKSPRGMDTKEQRRIPCPVLRFRIANELHSNKRGEIVDAELNVVATIDAKNSVLGIRSKKEFNDALIMSTSPGLSTSSIIKDSSAMITGAIRSVSLDVKKKVVRTARSFTTTNKESVDGGGMNYTTRFDDQHIEKTPAQTRAEKLGAIYQMRKSTLHLVQDQDSQDLSEEATDIDSSQSTSTSIDEASLMRSAFQRNQSVFFQQETNVEKPNLVYAEVSVTPNRHPFFRAVWTVSHVLDGTSPLLKKKARKAVADNNGYWPLSLNTVEGVQNSIHFDKLLISFKGQSSLSGTEVYHQHRYSMEHLNVGEQFRSVLMQNLDGSIFLNTKDIDETVVQDGGISSSLSLSTNDHSSISPSRSPSAIQWGSKDRSYIAHGDDQDEEAVSLLEGMKDKNMVVHETANVTDKSSDKNESNLDISVDVNDVVQDTGTGIVTTNNELDGGEKNVGDITFPVKIDPVPQSQDKSEGLGKVTKEEVIDLGLPLKKKGRKRLMKK